MKNTFSYVRIVILSLILSFVSLPTYASETQLYRKKQNSSRKPFYKVRNPKFIILAIALVESGGGSSKILKH